MVMVIYSNFWHWSKDFIPFHSAFLGPNVNLNLPQQKSVKTNFHLFPSRFPTLPLVVCRVPLVQEGGGYIFDHKWPAAPFIQSIERTAALFQNSSWGLWGVSLTWCHKHFQKPGEAIQPIFQVSPEYKKIGTISPRKPQRFCNVVEQRKRGSRRLVLNPVSVIPISKTFQRGSVQRGPPHQ